MKKNHKLSCNKKRCSGCLDIKQTVNRFLFDGLCAKCTDRALYDERFTKDAKELNNIFIRTT